MALKLADRIQDQGLATLRDEANEIWVLSSQPADYPAAVAAKLGTATAAFGNPSAVTGGRRIANPSISGGSVTAVGTVSHWAAVDTVNSRLLASGEVTGGVLTSMGLTWTLGGIAVVRLAELVSRTFDADVTAWEGAVVGASGTVSYARKILLDDLVIGLKADGVWSNLDRLYITAAENIQSADRDLVARVAATPPNSHPGIIVDMGYNVFGRGGTSLDINYIPSTQGVNFQRNSAHMAYWSANDTDPAGDAFFGYWGSADTMYNKASATAANITLNGPNLSATLPGKSCCGLLVGNRSGSTAAEVYLNGAQITATTSSTSVAPIANSLIMDYGDVCATSVGGSLTATQQLALYNRLLVYMQAVFKVTNIEVMGWLKNVYYYGHTVSLARRTLVDALVTDLKADGLWAKIDRLWIFAAENTYSALWDIRGNRLASAVNAPVHTADRGYQKTSNTSSYIDTGFNPVAAGFAYTQDSASAFAWSNTSGADSGPLIGLASGTSIRLFPQYTDNLAYFNINNTGGNGSQSGLSDGIGLWSTNRGDAISTDTKLYRNGSLVSTAAGIASAAVNQNILALAETGSLFSSRQICCLGFGGSMNATEQLALYNRLRTYMTAVGVP